MTRLRFLFKPQSDHPTPNLLGAPLERLQVDFRELRVAAPETRQGELEQVHTTVKDAKRHGKPPPLPRAHLF